MNPSAPPPQPCLPPPVGFAPLLLCLGFASGLCCAPPTLASDEVESTLQWRALGAHEPLVIEGTEFDAPQDAASTSADPSKPVPAVPSPKIGAADIGLKREQPCKDPDGNNEELISETARMLHETLCGASLWFDGLFGERNIEAARRAHGRLETSATYSEYYGFKERVRLDVRVDLPNLENRASAFIGRDDDDEFVRDRSEGFALRSQFPSVDDDDKWMAGLGYSLPGNRNFRSDFRVGARDLREPRVFVQNRIRYNAYADERNLLHLRATPFYNSRDGFGITPGIDYSYVITATRLLRWSNIGTLSENTEGFDWRSAVILYQSVGEGRGLAAETFARGATADRVPLREYGARLVYRHPLAQQKLFLELVSGYSWPREDVLDEREGSFLFAAGLELPFGRER